MKNAFNFNANTHMDFNPWKRIKLGIFHLNIYILSVFVPGICPAPLGFCPVGVLVSIILSSGNRHFFLWRYSWLGTWTGLDWQIGTGTSLQSCHEAILQTGLTSVTHLTELRGWHVKVLMSRVFVTVSGSWYQISCKRVLAGIFRNGNVKDMEVD